uniref:Uncharacterized protein n=1 Tax=Triticum urartu TaxID=4572 RepID=A0A8R7NVI4_TRIUA
MQWTGFRSVKGSWTVQIILIRSLWRCSRELMSPLLLRWTQMAAQVAGKTVGCAVVGGAAGNQWRQGLLNQRTG